MTSQPPIDGYTIEYYLGLVKIKIPGKKQMKQLLLLSAWLIFWLVVFSLIIAVYSSVIKGAFQNGSFNFSSIPMLIFLTFAVMIWGSRGYYAGYAFLWQFVGLETLEIAKDRLRVRKTLFGFGKTREYSHDQVTNILVANPLTISLPFLKLKFAQFDVPISGSVLVPLTNGKKEYLGFGLEQEQAQKISTIIRQQLFPKHI